jgi:predicted nucleic acid-binding protein
MTASLRHTRVRLLFGDNNVREFERVPGLTFENWAVLTDGPEISDFHA